MIKIEAAYGVWSWIILGVVLVLCGTVLYHVWKMPSLMDELEKLEKEYNKDMKSIAQDLLKSLEKK